MNINFRVVDEACTNTAYFLRQKPFCLRSNIKHFIMYFITGSNTSKFVKNTPLRVVFSTLFSVFDLVMKSCLMFDILLQAQVLSSINQCCYLS